MNMKKSFGIALVALVISSLLTYYLNQHSSGEVAGTKTYEEVRGIILPHHAVASELINESLKNLSQEKEFSHIIIFGPNHLETEVATFKTAEQLEGINLAKDIILAITEEFPEIIIDDERVATEHSIQELLPYVTEYFPNAKVIPLIISAQYNLDDLESKAKFFTQLLPTGSLFIASVDFSHEFMQLEAMEKNDETISTISNFDYPSLLNYEDDHLDSPVAMAEFLLTMNSLGATDFEVWHNTHGALILDNPTLQGTSYVIGVFY